MKAIEKRTKVSLQRCEEYHNEQLKLKIEEGLKNIEFKAGQFRGEKIAIKPSLLSPAPAQKAITTHPEFFRAVIQVVKKLGGHPVIIESPAIITLKKAIERTDFQKVIEEEGVEVANERETAILFNRNGRLFKRFEISKAFFQAGIIINLPKFKTHDFTQLSGAVKSLFGTIPGLEKAKWHTKAPSLEAFSEFLLDLYEALNQGFEKRKTFIHIMDGILGLEGNGPGAGGIPRKIGVIITSTDALAVDFLQAYLAGFDQRRVPLLRRGKERRLGAASFEEIDIVGEKVEDMKIAGFLPPATKPRISIKIEQRIVFSRLFKDLFIEKPIISESLCLGCFQCREICGSKAIYRAKKKKTPEIDYKKCIRCYCCQEICPEAAISLKPGKMQWLMDLISR